MQLFATDAKIDGAIVRVKSTGKTWENLVQRVLVSVLKRGLATKDFRKAAKQITALHDAFPGGARRTGLIKYVEGHFPLSFNTEEKVFVYTSMKGFTVDFDEAAKTLWSAYAPEEEYKPIADWHARIKSIVTAAQKDVKEMGAKSKVNKKELAVLEKMIG